MELRLEWELQSQITAFPLLFFFWSPWGLSLSSSVIFRMWLICWHSYFVPLCSAQFVVHLACTTFLYPPPPTPHILFTFVCHLYFKPQHNCGFHDVPKVSESLSTTDYSMYCEPRNYSESNSEFKRANLGILWVLGD